MALLVQGKQPISMSSLESRRPGERGGTSMREIVVWTGRRF